MPRQTATHRNLGSETSNPAEAGLPKDEAAGHWRGGEFVP
jgi:hypothetical protein